MRNPLRSPAIAAEQARSLGTAVARGARAHRASPLAVLRRARLARTTGGYEYDEALRLGLLDPRRPEDEIRRHASKHATLEAQRRVNPEALSPLTEEKAIFYRYLEAVGLPAPPLLGVVGRDAGYGSDDTVVADLDAFTSWLGGLPEEFVVKPSAGVHGDGVRIIRREAGALVAVGEGRVDPAGLYRDLTSHPEYPLWIVQARVRNSAEVARLGSPDALQTARIITVVDLDGRASVTEALLRLAAPGALTDNYRGGATGNAAVAIGPDGRLGPVRSMRPDGCGYRFTPHMPITGVHVEGESLEGWADAAALALRATSHFLPARTIGWDIALTPDGPMIIEANMWWDPPSTPDQGAAVTRLAASAVPTAEALG